MSFSVRNLANGVIQTVNPNIYGTVKVSIGSTTAPDGSRTPAFAIYPNVPMQVQAASGPTLAQLENMNIQGVVREVRLNGNIEGLDRLAGKGSDILFFNLQNWLVVAVLEAWDQSGWTRVAVTLQNT